MYLCYYLLGMHSCITPYRNFKNTNDPFGIHQKHDSTVAMMSAYIFNTTARVLDKIPYLSVISEEYDQLYKV
jgi:hypothetical protein